MMEEVELRDDTEEETPPPPEEETPPPTYKDAHPPPVTETPPPTYKEAPPPPVIETPPPTYKEAPPPPVTETPPPTYKEAPPPPVIETRPPTYKEAPPPPAIETPPAPKEETPPPPQEANSNCNHSDDDITSCPDEAAPGQPVNGTMVVQGNKNAAGEKLQRVRSWSISTYKCSRQALSEKLGRGSRTVDLDLEPRLELLRDDRRRYEGVAKLAETLANQIARFTDTQKTLGDAFSELSLKTPPLHVAFGVNAEAQKFLSKSGKTLADAVHGFTADMKTLVNKTIEDTMLNAKQYEAARVEYDAYRVDLEELNLGPRDPVTLPKLDRAQKDFQVQKERYQRMRDDLSVKVKLLEENKVKVLHQQLRLLHVAVATHSLSCQSFLEKNIQQAEKLRDPSLETQSWLEES